MEIETTIIGAGLIGLAVAAEISEESEDVFVLEKNPKFGQETSSRNSEVIHAGIYYPPNSLKAKLCVEGNQRLYELCQAHQIPHRKCGKLIVATNDEEAAQLDSILTQARANGVDDIQPISRKQINQLEPAVKAVAALYSPSTGIIDTHRLMAYLESKAKNNGANLVYKTQVERVSRCDGGAYAVHIVNPDGQRFSYTTRYLINCGGLEADHIAAALGIDIVANQYEQHFWKGEYFSVRGKAHVVNRLVYPVPLPNNVGLGVHATIDLNGQIRLGPNAKYLPERNYDYTVDQAEQKAFFESAHRFLPFIQYEDLSPAMAGIRPKLQRPGDAVRDFIIHEESDKGFPGVVNLVGMESPGLTSCIAIARYVKRLLTN
ncbi:MAG: NAD(P)/FAD-dependent oxidoreductase [Desulfobacterales bacterium]|nr:MAG: NAD(P)/FAD-dependent oxidoreductase [Desulfobacterales bacterium]